jgi:hypothetical protein
VILLNLDMKNGTLIHTCGPLSAFFLRIFQAREIRILETTCYRVHEYLCPTAYFWQGMYRVIPFYSWYHDTSPQNFLTKISTQKLCLYPEDVCVQLLKISEPNSNYKESNEKR